MNASAPHHRAVIDSQLRTIRPLDAAGDEWFGLIVGSNCTAAQSRRDLVTPAGFSWVRHDGRVAVGPTLIPGGSAWVNPWSGYAHV